MGLIKNLYDKAKNPINKEQNINETSHTQTPPAQHYVRQFVNAPEYDSRTLGIDTNEDIERLKNFFRGRRLSPDGKKYVEIPGLQVIMNEAGSEYLFSNHAQMVSIANATTYFENINQVLDAAEEYADNILEIICAKYREWEIDKAFFDLIVDTLARLYYFFLLKCLKDKQRVHMHGGTTQPMPEPHVPTM